MKRLFFILTIFFLSLPQTYAQSNKWSITKSTHFVVYHKNASEDFIKQLIDKAEDYYNKIASELGFTRYNFWLWDNRAKIYIYDNAKDYQVATGGPSWSGGSAVTKTKTIATYPYAQDFFETVLMHEMGHIIFREFVGFDNNAIPLWLEEGVASYQEKLSDKMVDSLIKEAVDKDKFMHLEELSKLNLSLVRDAELIKLFYTEAFSIVDFLLKKFGKDSFVFFCQNLRDKKDLERAIASVYPFSNLPELSRAWERYLKNEPR